jgi:hypothetical protein
MMTRGTFFNELSHAKKIVFDSDDMWGIIVRFFVQEVRDIALLRSINTHTRARTCDAIFSLSAVNTVTDRDVFILNRCSRLQLLDLSCQKSITNTVFVDLFNTCMPSLRELSLFNTNIDDNGLLSVSSISSLTHLDIGLCANVSDRGIKYVAGLGSLVTLNLDSIRLSDEAFAGFHKLLNLQQLHISQVNDITDRTIYGLPGLHTLDVMGCYDISSRALQNMGSSLKVLDVSSTNFDLVKLKDISLLVNLTSLTIGSGDLMPNIISDDDMAHLSALIHLEKFHVYRCTCVTNTGFESLKYMTKLHDLLINDVDGVDERVFIHMKRLPLVRLSMAYCQNVYNISHISKIKSLQYLDLTNTFVGEDCMEDLKQMKNSLTILDISGTYRLPKDFRASLSKEIPHTHLRWYS